MEKITKGIYTYHHGSPQEEIDLKDSTLDMDLTKATDFEIKEAVSRVLKLDFSEQVHVVHCVLDSMYTLSDVSTENSAVEKFLADKAFNKHRDVIMSVVNDGDELEDAKKREELETELGIKIVEFEEEV